MGAPNTLPANFFEKQAGASAAPDVLPSDFFEPKRKPLLSRLLPNRLAPGELTGSRYEAVPGSDSPEAQQARLGEMVPEAVVPALHWLNKYLIQPFDKAAMAGRTAARRSVEPITVQPGQGLSGVGIAPEGTVEQHHPVAGPILKAVAGVAGSTVADPRNWPFLASGAARPILQKIISGGFGTMMGKATIDSAKQLSDNWDNMTPQQRLEVGTETGLTGLMAAGTAIHAVTPISEVPPERPTLLPQERPAETLQTPENLSLQGDKLATGQTHAPETLPPDFFGTQPRPTHPAGEVTGIDEATGLPIVRRTEGAPAQGEQAVATKPVYRMSPEESLAAPATLPPDFFGKPEEFGQAKPPAAPAFGSPEYTEALPPGPSAVNVSGEVGGGNYGFRGSPPDLPTAADISKNTELIRKSDILRSLSEKLNQIPIRTGHFREYALGIFKVRSEAIRTRTALDLPVASHEIGHYINKILWGTKGEGLNWKPLAPFRDELQPIATKPRAGQSKLPEGLAEFTRMYLTNPVEALAKAPRFYQFFEKELAREPQVRDALKEAQGNIRRYIQQPAAAKILAHISKEDRPGAGVSWQGLYTGAVDKMAPIKTFVKELRKDDPNSLPTEEDAGKLAQLMSGWVGKAETFLERGTFDPSKPSLPMVGKPLREILRPVRDNLDNLRAYLVARRAVEKNAQGINTGISTADAKEVLAELGSERMKAVAKDLGGFNDSLLNYAKDAGLISAEGLKKIKAMNEAYVPFYRVMEERQPGGQAGAGRTFADLWSPVKRMKGSGREIIDPLESMVKNTYTLINLAERNKVASAMVRLAENTPGTAKWIEQVPGPLKPTSFELADIRKQLQSAGFDIAEGDLEQIATVFTPSGRAPQGENIISVMEDGKRKFYQVEPSLYRAIKGLDEETLPLVFRLLSLPAQLLRVGATSLSPSFAFRNPLRDAGDAFMQSENGFIPGYHTVRGLFHALKKDDLYYEWKRSGGEHSMLVSMDRTHLQQNLRDLLSGKLRNVARHPIEALKMLSEFTEEASRLGEYELSRKAGKTPATAALESRNVTVDFSRIGARTKAMNAITAFWNAGIQGTDLFFRTHWDHPLRTLSRGIVGLTVPSLILYSLNKDDPRYQELPRWEKDFFFIIPTFRKDTPFIRLPKPFLYGMVYSSLPERAMEWLNTKSPRAFEQVLANLGTVALPSPIPTAAVPPLEAWANKSFYTNRPLVPGYLQKLPPKYQAQPYTSQFAKDAALAASRLGIQVSPIQIDNTVFGYTGGAGRTATGALDYVLKDKTNEPPARRVTENPILGAFTARWPDSNADSVRRFYDRKSELEAKANAVKFERKFPGRAPGAKDDLTPAERSELARLRGVENRISNLVSRSRKVISNPKLSGEEKRTELDRLQTQIINEARRVTNRQRPLVPLLQGLQEQPSQ